MSTGDTLQVLHILQQKAVSCSSVPAGYPRLPGLPPQHPEAQEALERTRPRRGPKPGLPMVLNPVTKVGPLQGAAPVTKALPLSFSHGMRGRTGWWSTGPAGSGKERGGRPFSSLARDLLASLPLWLRRAFRTRGAADAAFGGRRCRSCRARSPKHRQPHANPICRSARSPIGIRGRQGVRKTETPGLTPGISPFPSWWAMVDLNHRPHAYQAQKVHTYPYG